MSKHPLYNLLFFYIIINLLSVFYQEIICDLNNNNSFCESCDNEANDYSKCKYQDLYCVLSKEKNIYSQCKQLYSKSLRNNKDNDVLCGEKDIIFNTNKHNQTIFQLTEEDHKGLNLKYLHCDYHLIVNNLNDSSTNKINITLSLENIANDNNNNFNFFFFLLKNNIFNSDNLITKEKLFSTSKIITLEYFQNISLYLDINIPDNFFPKFSIYIEYFNYENEEGEEIEMEKEDMFPIYLTLYIAIPLLILLVALIIYLCCKKQDTGILGGEIRVIGFANNENEVGEESEETKSKTYKYNETKKKLVLLFKTVLGAQEYTKSHSKIDCPKCTICYEDFELYNSVVSITPCQHIFHYKCLHNWLNKNAMNSIKCPNCNFDLMTIDINAIRQKMQNSIGKAIQREGSINENLLGKNNLKNNNINCNNSNNSSNSNNNINNTNNNIFNHNNRKNKNQMNKKEIIISHISINYNLSNNKKNKDNENENDSDNESEENQENESNNKIDNGNIYNSQNCLNDDEDSKNDNDDTHNKKKNKNENNIINTNSKSSNISNDNNTGTKISSNINSSKKKEGYKTLRQDLASTRRNLN